MSPSHSFLNDENNHPHQSRPTRPLHNDHNFGDNPHHPNHGIFTSERRSQNGCHRNEAEECERSFYKTNTGNHREERDEIELDNEEKSQKEAGKYYWRALAELIPLEDNPSSVVAEGPEPAKPFNLTRMSQVSLRLRHSLLSHMMLPTPDNPEDEAADSN